MHPRIRSWRESRRSPQSRRTLLASSVVTLALVAASCSGSATNASDSSSASTDSASTDSVGGQSGAVDSGSAATAGAVTTEDDFMDIEVVNLADGAKVKFNEKLAGEDTPVLMWFYLPH